MRFQITRSEVSEEGDQPNVVKQHVFAMPVIDFGLMGDIPAGQHWLILTHEDCGNMEGAYDVDVTGLQLKFSRLPFVEPDWPGDGETESDSRKEFVFWHPFVINQLLVHRSVE